MESLMRNMEIINKAVESIDIRSLERLKEDCNLSLNEGHKIIVSGLGKNVAVCEKFVGTMLSLGMNAGFLHTNSAVHGDVGMVKPGDVLIILSKSGETQESKYLYNVVKDWGARLWTLTFEKNSYLAQEIGNSIVVELEHEGDMWDIVPNNSTILNLIVLQELAINLARDQEITLEDFKKNHPGGHIGELLSEQEDLKNEA